MPKTIPRIGRQDLLKGIEKLPQLVNFHGDLTEAELREEMEAINQNRSSKLFKDIDDWLTFTMKDQNRSIEIIQKANDHIELTEEGEELLNAADFRATAFDLLERKSRTNFTYFHKTLQELDRKVQRGNYDIGTDLDDTVNSLMKDTVGGNSVTAGAIACLLKDFEIVTEEDGLWMVDPAQYTYFRGDDEDIVEDVVAEHGNQIHLAELERMLMVDFEWGRDKVDTVINGLIDQHRLAKDRYEGRTVIEKIA